jgi:hypothetical protein
LDIVETFHTVCCSACAWELVAGLLRPRLFLLAKKLSKAKVSGTIIINIILIVIIPIVIVVNVMLCMMMTQHVP